MFLVILVCPGSVLLKYWMCLCVRVSDCLIIILLTIAIRICREKKKKRAKQQRSDLVNVWNYTSRMHTKIENFLQILWICLCLIVTPSISMCCRWVYISHIFDHLILYCSIILAHIVCIYRLLSPHFKKTHQLCELFVFVSISFSVLFHFQLNHFFRLVFLSFSLFFHQNSLVSIQYACICWANKVFLSLASCSSTISVKRPNVVW